MGTSAFVNAAPLLGCSSFAYSQTRQSRRSPQRPGSARAPARHPTRLPQRVTPSARVRRGFKPELTLPESLHTAEPIRDIDYKPFDYSQLEGRVVLVVNVASDDPNTEAHYKTFARLLELYHEDGFEIVAYPSNWYGQCERGTNEEIKKFIHEKCSDKVHIMAKTDLEWDPVFAMGCRYFPGEVIWNFHGKFLFGKKGLPVARFDLLTSDEHLEDRIGYFLRTPAEDHVSTMPDESDLPDENDISVIVELTAQSQAQAEEEEAEEPEPEPEAEVDLDFADAEESD